jgi:hypothetical protein
MGQGNVDPRPKTALPCHRHWRMENSSSGPCIPGAGLAGRCPFLGGQVSLAIDV